jgi:hypothetical protein
MAGEVRRDHLLARLGDWGDWYEHVEVVQELEGEGKHILVLRLGDTSAPAPSLLVDLDADTVFRMDSVSHLPGVGRMGSRTNYADYRDVGGMLLPFLIRTEYANPLLGEVLTHVESYDLGVELPADAFRLVE